MKRKRKYILTAPEVRNLSDLRGRGCPSQFRTALRVAIRDQALGWSKHEPTQCWQEASPNSWGECQSRAETGCWLTHLSRIGYLFFRMRPVKAQQEIGVPAVQEEICCSEGNREALNIVAEVGGDPEVRDEGVHKDILGRERPTRRKVSLQG